MSILDDLKAEYRMGGVVQRLIFWNIGLFLFPLIAFTILSFSTDVSSFDWRSGANDWFSLSSNPADLLWKPWSIIGYAFLHGNVLHILFNMMMLFFSGRLFLTFFTQKQFFGLYLLSAIFAGLVYISGYSLVAPHVWSKMVGASAAIMAILIASATYSPYYQVRLLLIGTVKLWHLAIVLVALDLIYVTAENSGGHVAHLSGALFGFVYIKLLQNGTDLSKGVSAVLDFFANLFKPKKNTPFKKVHRNDIPKSRTTTEPKKNKDITQQQIDDILDKISKSGYDSLTKEEKEFLFKVGK